jgi:hypothetical protein
VLSPHAALGLVASRRKSPVCGGARLSSSSCADQARRSEADHGRQVPYRCFGHRLSRLRSRAAAKSLAVSASGIVSSLHPSANSFQRLSNKTFAHGVLGRVWRVLAATKSTTGDDTARGTQAQEFRASFWASGVAFLTAFSSLPTILHRTTVGGILVARAERYCA